MWWKKFQTKYITKLSFSITVVTVIAAARHQIQKPADACRYTRQMNVKKEAHGSLLVKFMFIIINCKLNNWT